MTRGTAQTTDTLTGNAVVMRAGKLTLLRPGTEDTETAGNRMNDSYAELMSALMGDPVSEDDARVFVQEFYRAVVRHLAQEIGLKFPDSLENVLKGSPGTSALIVSSLLRLVDVRPWEEFEQDSDSLFVDQIYRQEPADGVQGCTSLCICGGPKRYARIWDGADCIEWGWTLSDHNVRLFPREKNNGCR